MSPGVEPLDEIKSYNNESLVTGKSGLSAYWNATPGSAYHRSRCLSIWAVTTRIGAVYEDMIESCQCGLLVLPDDPAALAQGVLQIANCCEIQSKASAWGVRAGRWSSSGISGPRLPNR